MTRWSNLKLNVQPKRTRVNLIRTNQQPRVNRYPLTSLVPVVNFIRLASAAESDDPLRDVGFLRMILWAVVDLFRPWAALEAEILAPRIAAARCLRQVCRPSWSTPSTSKRRNGAVTR